MTNKAKIKNIAKVMLENSKSAGLINNAKVEKTLKSVISTKPTQLVAILKEYKNQVSKSLSKEEVTVEVPKDYKKDKQFEVEILKRTKAKRIVYKINPDIVFGVKIKYSDWLYELSLDSKLKAITAI